MNKKKAGIIFIAILAAAAAAFGIWYFLGNGGRDSNDRVYVQKVSAIMGSATGIQNRYSGVVQPQKTVEVKADSERTIGEVLVAVGDTVEEGTPLFTYDVEDLKLELEQGKLELDNQDIEINNFKNQIQELDKERKAAAEANKFEYTTQIQTIETQIKKAEFEKSSKQLELDKLQKRIDDSQVTSKASGVIKSINDGEQGGEEMGSSSAFITILSTGEYRIQGTVNEQNVGMLSSGAEVIVRSRVDENVTWRGTIDSIDTEEADSGSTDEEYMDSSSDSSTSSSQYPFYVALENAEGLMLGQHVLIELDEGQTEEKEGIWLYSYYIVREGAQDDASAQAESLMEGMEGTEFSDFTDFSDFSDGTELMDMADDSLSSEMPEGGGQAYVWADNGNGRLEKRAVELGEYDPNLDEYEIISGLSEDDLIAWPMEGLYEGVRTVTDPEEVDYTSGLYNQENGTEALMDGTEGMMDEEFMDDGMLDDGMTDGGMDMLDGDADLTDGGMTDGVSDDGGEDGAADMEGAE